jgi:acyl-CoA synthetase (AMP-forming)/AMP-acid ligase II
MPKHLPLIERAVDFGTRTAIIDPTGTYSYADLLEASRRVAARLLDGGEDLREARIAFLVTPGFAYVATQWGIWRAGGIAVPLGLAHPTPELEYVLDDTGASHVLADAALLERVRLLAEGRGLPLYELGEVLPATGEEDESALPAVESDRRAMILYTSGTTSKPKGVVTTHAMIQAQIETLMKAWGWTANDRILHVLPLHHVHGIINVLSCALWSGAVCEMPPKFDVVHGGADHLRKADRPLAAGLDRRAAGDVGRLPDDAADGLRLGGAAGLHAPDVAQHQRSHLAGTLRHDRNRHGAFQPAPRPARARVRGNAAARDGGATG